MGKKILVVVDMQNDFVDGALGTAEAVSIVPNVVKKINEYEKNGDAVIYTKDTHFEPYLDTNEGKHLPVVHCIKGTNGWQICESIKLATNLDSHQIYEKVTFGSSAFAQDLASGDYNEYDEFEFVGLCTDICVISNVMLAKTFLPEKEIIVDASCCAGVTPESHQNALNAMKMCHITIVNE